MIGGSLTRDCLKAHGILEVVRYGIGSAAGNPTARGPPTTHVCGDSSSIRYRTTLEKSRVLFKQFAALSEPLSSSSRSLAAPSFQRTSWPDASGTSADGHHRRQRERGTVLLDRPPAWKRVNALLVDLQRRLNSFNGLRSALIRRSGQSMMTTVRARDVDPSRIAPTEAARVRVHHDSRSSPRARIARACRSVVVDMEPIAPLI